MSSNVTICAVGTAPALVDQGLSDRFTVVREANLEVHRQRWDRRPLFHLVRLSFINDFAKPRSTLAI